MEEQQQPNRRAKVLEILDTVQSLLQSAWDQCGALAGAVLDGELQRGWTPRSDLHSGILSEGVRQQLGFNRKSCKNERMVEMSIEDQMRSQLGNATLGGIDFSIPAGATQSRPEVAQCVDRLTTTTEALLELVKTLEEKLNPVLEPVPTTNIAELDKDAVQGGVPLATSLNIINSRTQQAVDSLNDIIKRIQV